ncbi:hypothetical protein BCR44DRAFT_1009324 [Catenaria anguillulae PL171]|uniref:Uncharacterized protein n=1 Tax=Catenaria anguillulae PL171 TaxID=765915 RepID=A0A1Y2I485_9FUNG|nr:hypothetical protein BCR44DRAFT_1009324 [Catenaria anguillulae PL171]
MSTHYSSRKCICSRLWDLTCTSTMRPTYTYGSCTFYVLSTCWMAPRHCTRAWNLANDSFRVPLALYFPPHAIGAACVELAVRQAHVTVPDTWAEIVADVHCQDIDFIVHQLVANGPEHVPLPVDLPVTVGEIKAWLALDEEELKRRLVPSNDAPAKELEARGRAGWIKRNTSENGERPWNWRSGSARDKQPQCQPPSLRWMLPRFRRPWQRHARRRQQQRPGARPCLRRPRHCRQGMDIGIGTGTVVRIGIGTTAAAAVSAEIMSGTPVTRVTVTVTARGTGTGTGMVSVGIILMLVAAAAAVVMGVGLREAIVASLLFSFGTKVYKYREEKGQEERQKQHQAVAKGV